MRVAALEAKVAAIHDGLRRAVDRDLLRGSHPDLDLASHAAISAGRTHRPQARISHRAVDVADRGLADRKRGGLRSRALFLDWVDDLRDVMVFAPFVELEAVEEVWLTVDEAAELIGRAPRTVRLWAKQGTIRARPDGTRWLIPESACHPATPRQSTARRAA